jgi:hypothetical protein
VKEKNSNEQRQKYGTVQCKRSISVLIYIRPKIFRRVGFKTGFGIKHKNPHYIQENNKKICTAFLSKFVIFLKKSGARQPISKTFSSYEYSKYVEQTISPTETSHISDSRV